MGGTEPWDIFALDGRGESAFDLDHLSWSYRLARAVQVAYRLGLFDALLTGPRTADEVVEECGTQPQPTERLLVVLAAAGFLYRHPDGRFRLTAPAREALDPSSPLAWRAGLAHTMQSWERWHQLETIVRDGAPGGPPPQDGHAIFVGAMHDYSVRGRAQWLAGNVDLSDRRRLLDLGGGPGTYSIALCQRFANLRATILDQAATEPLARANVARFGLTERIDFVVGDYNAEQFGEGYDAALLSNVLHGPHMGCEARLQATWRTLDPGGRLVIQDFLLDDDRNGPLPAAIFNLHVGAYTIGEMLTVITAAGFREARLIGRGPHGNGLILADRPG